MIRVSGDRLEVSGAMTLPEASALLAEGANALGDSPSVFDLSGVTDVDSSGLAVLFGWIRAAQAKGKTISITHPPKNLLSLAEVYDVAGLLPLA
jgi:phospholipid transport system transporter-binding protein